MNTESEYPFPASSAASADEAGAVERVAAAAAAARERLADATVRAQDRAEAFGDRAAGYIQQYPFRSVIVASALGFLLGLLATRLPR